MKKIFIILCLLFLMWQSGCSYVFPDSTSVKPATVELKEKTEVVDPGRQQDVVTERIKITRGGKKEVVDEVKDGVK